MTAEEVLRPLLAGYPDARRAPVALLEPTLFPYVALMFGGPAAALLSCYNAIALRRWGLVFRSLLLGLIAFITFGLTLSLMLRSGANAPIALIGARIVSFALGSVLFVIHRPYASGHAFLHGMTLPLLNSYLAVFALSMVMPYRIKMLILSGGILGL